MEKLIKMDKTAFYESDKRIFSNVYLIGLILIIALLFIGYVIYNTYLSSVESQIQSNSSFYGKDITLYEPLFKLNTNSITDCIDICNQDITCDGLTYNNDTQTCTGTKNGLIRNETSSYSAWIKPVSNTDKRTIRNKDFSKAILVGYTKTPRIIKGMNIPNPFMLGYMCFSFNLTIYDFYKNYGYWRHIMHKGTPIETGNILSYQSWENLIKDIPNQSVGIWLAPFTNNLRIAITTTSLANRNAGSYPDAFVEKCNNQGECYITDMPSGKWVDNSKMGDGSVDKTRLESYVEYFDQDLQNIPINTQLNITINLRNRDVEVYFNGKIVKIAQLDGTPNNDKSNLYILNEKSVNCEMSNLIYYPDALSLEDIKNVLAINPQSSS